MGMYPERWNQVVPQRHHLKLPDVVKEKEEWGMTLTPLAKASPGGNGSVPSNETGAISARAPDSAAGRTTENDYETETELRGTGKAD